MAGSPARAAEIPDAEIFSPAGAVVRGIIRHSKLPPCPAADRSDTASSDVCAWLKSEAPAAIAIGSNSRQILWISLGTGCNCFRRIFVVHGGPPFCWELPLRENRKVIPF